MFLILPLVVIALALPLCLHWWGLKALSLFALEAPAIAFAVFYAVLGRRVKLKKAALPRPASEVADCLMFRRPFESPGLAVLYEDRLELIPIVGSPITVILADIVAVKEVRRFNGTRLWLKKGFVMDLANGQRVGVAVAEVFARRWRAVLSRGTPPEIQAGTPVQPEAQGPRLARAALCGAIWAPLCLIMAGLFLLPHRVAIEPGTLPRGPAW